MLDKLIKLLSYSLLSKLCLFFFQLLLTYLLTVDDYGSFGRWMTDIGMFGAIVVFGLDNSFVYYSKDKQSVYLNLVRSLFFYFFVSVVMFAFFGLILGELQYYSWLFFYVFLSSVYQVIRSFFMLKEKFGFFGFFDFIRPFVLLTLSVFIYFTNVTVDFYEVVYLQAAVLVLSLVIMIGFFILYSKASGRVQINKYLFDFKYFFYGAKSLMNTFLALLLYSTTIYYISFFGDNKQLAIFFVAATISKLMWVIPDTIGSIVYPTYVKAVNEDLRREAFINTGYYLRVCFLINCCVFLLFFILGRFFINLMYAQDYVDVYIYVLILLFGNQGMVVYKILSRYLASKNSWGGLRVALMLGVASNLIVNTVFFAKYGLIAASMATSVSFWVCGLVVSFYVPKSLGMFFKLPRVKEIIK